MKMKTLKWDDLTCMVPQEYIDRGFNLVDGAAPWVYVQTGDDLRLMVTESWLCEKAGWMFTDIDLSFEEIVLNRLKMAIEDGSTIEEKNQDKRELVASLNKLIKKIESF